MPGVTLGEVARHANLQAGPVRAGHQIWVPKRSFLGLLEHFWAIGVYIGSFPHPVTVLKGGLIKGLL